MVLISYLLFHEDSDVAERYAEQGANSTNVYTLLLQNKVICKECKTSIGVKLKTCLCQIER